MNLTPLHPWIARKIGCPPERLTHGDIEAYQLRQVRQTLQLARRRGQFYRQHLADAPPELVSLDALVEFPFTTAEDIRRNPLQFLCVSQSEIQRVVTLDSSGTTGAPKRLYFTQEDQELTLDFFNTGMSTFTDAGDRVLILLPGERAGSVGDLLVTALPRFGAVGIKHGPVLDATRTLQVMAQENVTGLVGLPTHLLALVRHPQAGALPQKPKSILLTADHVPEAIKTVVEQTWGCRVYNHYGMTEMGLGGGVECQARRGYHLREADLYVEIVNPQTGQPVAEGETGEVVFTTLTRRGMPLIRYRTGDLSRFIPGACPCGTILKTLERVKGRASGFINLGGGNFLTMADLDEALFPLAGVLNFAAAVTREGGQTWLHLDIFPAAGASDDLEPAVQRALAAIPAIAAAQQRGELAVRLHIQPAGSAGAVSLGKRTISDQRTI